MLIKNCIGGTVSVVVRREALELISDEYFSTEFPAREEYDLWIRISKKWEVDFISKPLVKAYYRDNIERISSTVGNYVTGIDLINRNHKHDFEELLTKEEYNQTLSFQQFFLGSQAIKIGNVKLARKYYLESYKISAHLEAILSYLLSFLGVKTILISRWCLGEVKLFRGKNE
jgi:ABC-type multidrug transport system fused ATPase/permease subunit